MSLPDFPSLFSPPRTTIEQFLRQNIDNSDPDYLDKFVLAYARCRGQIAQLESQLSAAKLDRSDYIASERKLFVEEATRNKEKVVLAEFERDLESDRSLRKMKDHERELLRRIGLLKAYADAFEMKAQWVPGEQGRINRHMDMSKYQR